MTTDNHDLMNDAEPDSDPRLTAHYRAGSQEQSPSHLDDAILAMARREVHAKPRSAKIYSSRWAVPVSIAAVLVLSVSLVTLIKQEIPETLTQAPKLSKPAESKPKVGMAEKKEEAKRRTLPSSSMSDVEQSIPPSAPLKKERRRKTGNQAAKSATTKAEAIAPQDGVFSKPEVPAPAPDAKQAMPTQQQSELREDSIRSADKPLPAIKSSPTLRMQAETAKKSAEKKVVSPEQWLKAIDELLKQGKQDDARKSLKRFRKQYPYYSLEKRFLDLIQEKRVDK